MNSRLTAIERRHLARIKEMPCGATTATRFLN